MPSITINLPETDSADGVSLSTLEAYVKQRGSNSVEEFINILIADALGFRPPIAGSAQRFPELARLSEALNRKP